MSRTVSVILHPGRMISCIVGYFPFMGQGQLGLGLWLDQGRGERYDGTSSCTGPLWPKNVKK